MKLSYEYLFEFNDKDRIILLDKKFVHSSKNENEEKNTRQELVDVLAKVVEQAQTNVIEIISNNLQTNSLTGITLGGRYELLNKVQDKKNTVVYKGRCKLLNRYVFVEVLKKKCNIEDVEYRIYRSAAEKAATLSHPNIMNVYDCGCDNGIGYTVKEYIDGQTLDEYMKANSKIYLEQAICISQQIIKGLDHAFKNGVVNADLCPENIYIRSDNTVKINYNYVNANPEEKENYHYISPEIARGGYVTFKSDVYSLGCIMFRLFVGRTPFKNAPFVSLALEHIQTIPGSPKLVNGLIPKDISKVIQKCLEKDIQNRYSSCDEIYNESKILRDYKL